MWFRLHKQLLVDYFVELLYLDRLPMITADATGDGVNVVAGLERRQLNLKVI